MKKILYSFGKFFINLSGKEFEMEGDLFDIVKTTLDFTKDNNIDKDEISLLREKNYNILIKYGFTKR